MGDLWDYEFELWIDSEKRTPIELNGIPKVDLVNLLRRALSSRQVLEAILPQDFSNIREALWKMGFEMHCISRKPYFLEETVL